MIVCYSVNDNYYDLFEVSLKSLLDFNTVSIVYVLNSKLSDEFIQRARSICDNKCEIEFKNIDINMFRNIEIGHLGAESYYRLLLPELINDDKAWYIDVDTLILGSIEQPYYENLDFMVAAVPVTYQDSAEMGKKRLNMSKNAEYFNAGVLLLNLVKLRNDDFFKAVIEWIYNNLSKINLADQDALNAMLNGHYNKLDIRYNVTTEVVNEIKNPIIVHFTGEFKPNLFLFRHPYKKLFMRYFSYNKKSFDFTLNLKYFKEIYMNRMFEIAPKIPFIMRIYRKLNPKK